MKKISYVIPCYKSALTIEKVVDEIRETMATLSQYSYEIILVNDGATDGSGAVCDAYAKKDERIRVIHKPNGGLTSAWKAGAEIATGRYLGFVDSDDWIDEDMYKNYMSLYRRLGGKEEA